MKKTILLLVSLLGLCLPWMAFANSGHIATLDATATWYGFAALALFVIAYALVMFEDVIHLRKSKPVILAAGLIWVLVAIVGSFTDSQAIVTMNLNHALLEYGELFLFLLVAMTYINMLEERFVFEALKSRLLRMGLGYRGIFWLTGLLAFFISPVADNLTTALVMCTVVLSIGRSNPKFVCLACVNIVVAANAGGAFSPFGDITTLMVWQDGAVTFSHFFVLFVPAVVNFLIPAMIMNFFVPKMANYSVSDEIVHVKEGAFVTLVLFLLTIVTAVLFENLLHLPPALGMMTGLGYLMFYSYWLGHKEKRLSPTTIEVDQFDIFKKVKNAEWDTLLFFYGILVAVQGLSTLGYLTVLSQWIYQDMASIAPVLFTAQTQANTLIGILSAIVDNIPVMFAVLTMHPHMVEGQWLLITLTAGVGGSLLSIGSAAGVAVMGKANGIYTFMGHLKWTWAIALGYFASIVVHLWLNHAFFVA